MDTYEFLADPRVLPLAQRRDLASLHAIEQQEWYARLQHLAEPSVQDPDFPAFLLALPPFADLGRRIGNARDRQQLGTAIADELDWFVRVFADYLHSDADEDIFASSGDEPGARASGRPHC